MTLVCYTQQLQLQCLPFDVPTCSSTPYDFLILSSGYTLISTDQIDQPLWKMVHSKLFDVHEDHLAFELFFRHFYDTIFLPNGSSLNECILSIYG